jgi:hypothetical protein
MMMMTAQAHAECISNAAKELMATYPESEFAPDDPMLPIQTYRVQEGSEKQQQNLLLGV